MAQALAEKRRAFAIAAEQENIAEVTANQAKVVLAEAEVPKAVADSFRSGNLWIGQRARFGASESASELR